MGGRGVKLFSFAYAGGDGHVFYPMKDSLAKLGITVFPYIGASIGSCDIQSQLIHVIMSMHFLVLSGIRID